MQHPYTDEKNVLILIALLKAHGIRHVVASPGSANSSFTVSLDCDGGFHMVSAVDERSAAYMACGIAEETGEPVVITCTGATASRNYFPGLTEAYYRKLPILAVTATQDISKVGHHIAQVIDRSRMPVDTYKLSLNLPIVKDADDEWDCQIKVNRAILELQRNGGGPVHLNLPTSLGQFNVESQLPDVRVIRRFTTTDTLPALPEGRIAVFIGSHKAFPDSLTAALEAFCEKTGAAVLCDHTSSYKGKNRVLTALLANQIHLNKRNYRPQLLIHIGEVTGDYSIYKLGADRVWRVNEDGEIRDTFRVLTEVFEMGEVDFFRHYAATSTAVGAGSATDYQSKDEELRKSIPDMPISNTWVASRLAHRIPEGSTVHFAILNSLRSWNFFPMPDSVRSASNVGGFGIDGNLSTLIGASLAYPDRLFYCVIGDLAFFYDMNSLGNRHVGNNLRIILVNNGKGAEFLTYRHRNATLGESADRFVSAGGHFGRQSRDLIRHYAQDLGLKYLAAENKEEFEQAEAAFLDPTVGPQSIVLEVFTTSDNESEAQKLISHIEPKGPHSGNSAGWKKVAGSKVSKLKRFISGS